LITISSYHHLAFAVQFDGLPAKIVCVCVAVSCMS